jgi:hypothetical protein
MWVNVAWTNMNWMTGNVCLGLLETVSHAEVCVFILYGLC